MAALIRDSSTVKVGDGEVTVRGWIQDTRNLGGISFIALRDRYGVIQLTLPKKKIEPELFKTLTTISRESVVAVTGEVKESNQTELGLEIIPSAVEVYSEASTPLPMGVIDKVNVEMDTRLNNRFMDLRKPEIRAIFELKSLMVRLIVEAMEENGFTQVYTPKIVGSGAEGGATLFQIEYFGKKAYLAQSPQLYKQMLMVAGMDRYYQVARCFRDEDSRKDRQPEFTQLDIEMSFIEEKDIQDNMERMLAYIWKGLYGEELQIPFPRISYMEAMERYGSDKPDLRYGLPLEKLTEVFRETNYGIMKKIVAEGGIIVGMNLKKDIAGDKIGRNDVDRYIALAKKFGLGGLTWMRVVNGELDSNIVKYFTDDNKKGIKETMKAEEGDLIFLMAGPWKRTLEGAGLMRRQLAADLGLVPEGTFQFHWLVDCPMFEVDPVSGKKDAFHHPFVLPYDNFKKGACFDILLNGNELGSGSMRINRPEMQVEVLHQLGLSDERIEENFGWFIKALSYGAPPHGGIAIGVDRVIAILLGKETIRDTIAFPKNKKAESLIDGSPDKIDDEKLEELQLMSLAMDDVDFDIEEEDIE